MSNAVTVGAATAAVVLCAGLAAGQSLTPPAGPTGPACAHSCDHGADEAMQERAERLIEAQTFWALPAEHRAKIADGLAERGEAVPMMPDNRPLPPEMAERAEPMGAEEFEAAFAAVEEFTTREAFERFSPIHQRMLASFAEQVQQDDWIPVMTCFVPGTDGELIMAFDEIVTFGLSNLERNNPALFEQTGRWGGTALDPSGGGQGNPTILTYSFPPDGTFIPNGTGEGSGNNDLNAFMDGIYGNRSTWRALYDQIFDRWEELSGVTYVLEPNDDGASFDFTGSDSAPGVSGVRGDLRMAGKFIDGSGGPDGSILAYNFFPQNGDMVVDTGDPFYSNTGGNSLRLRNVLAHEHGHGMGQLHTCPIEQLKLMEPFVSVAFDGPQLDDILNAQRHYGDPLEPNNNSGTASDFGNIAVNDLLTQDNVSLDDDNDVDFYEITVLEAAELTATVRPQGFAYNAGPQTQFCNEAQPYNPLFFLDPAVAIIDSNGSTVLNSSDSSSAGVDESVTATVQPGTYYVRVSGSSPSGDQIIAYELDVSAAFDALSIAVGSAPVEFFPGLPSSFLLEISPDGEQLVGTPTLSYAFNGSTGFITVDLVNVGGETWRADFPPFECGAEPQYFVTAQGSISGTNRFPETGRIFASVVGDTSVTFDDDGSSDLGYTTSGNAGDGAWELGQPEGNDRGDPAVDFDGNNSCWLTRINPADENSDVDDGEVVLTTPALDLTIGSSVSYAYWFNDVDNGSIQGGDSFRVQVSTNNGASYSTVRTVTSASDSWRTDTLVAGVDYTGGQPGQGRVRFIANDIGTQNVIEAGVDAVLVSSSVCEDTTPGCGFADLAEPFFLLDALDLFEFLNAAEAQESAGDLAVPGGSVDAADVDAFIDLLEAGCP